VHGHVILKKDVLQHLRLKTDDITEVDRFARERRMLKAAQATGTMSDAIGLLAKQRKKVATIEEINQASAKAWSDGK
jgi:antitoxin PrlF